MSDPVVRSQQLTKSLTKTVKRNGQCIVFKGKKERRKKERKKDRKKERKKVEKKLAGTKVVKKAVENIFLIHVCQ